VALSRLDNRRCVDQSITRPQGRRAMPEAAFAYRAQR
jgi:hypothetical protein